MKFLLVLLFFATFSFAQNAETFYKEGKRRMSEKQYKEAIAYLSKAITIAPDSIKYLMLRGDAYVEIYNFNDAYKDYTRVLNLDGNNVFAYLKRAQTLLNSKMYYEAIKDNNMVVMLTDVDSLKEEALKFIALARLEMRDFDGALLDYKKALTYDSLAKDIYNDMGMIYLEIGDSAMAFWCVKKALQIDKNMIEAYANLGYIYSRFALYKESIVCFDSVLNRNPKMAFTYNNRGFSKFKMGDLKGAMRDINMSIKLLPTNSYAYKNRALVYIEQKNYNKACADLQKANKLNFKQQYGKEVEELMYKFCK